MLHFIEHVFQIPLAVLYMPYMCFVVFSFSFRSGLGDGTQVLLVDCLARLYIKYFGIMVFLLFLFLLMTIT